MGRRRNLTSVIRDRSLFIAWEGGEDFRGDHLILGRKKGGNQSQLVIQKGESLKNLEGFRGGTTQIWLENKGMGEGRGGDRENGQKLLGAITSVK